MKLWPFEVVLGANDKPKIVVNYKGKEKQLPTEEISSMVRLKTREIKKKYLGSTIKNAVITVQLTSKTLSARGCRSWLASDRVAYLPTAAIYCHTPLGESSKGDL
ncbi:hypothetical protein RJ640_001393 [Escallonia rubra]|uniref:Uncharacterized protein n=1 Tax=Escallonia rubra TaxID=112253 RepID=A0AA88QS86_9ASTE|nr:hypothetical protein RJ640_001393 [Escallonia rubra]